MLAECSSSRLKQSRLSKHKRDNSINNFNNRITIQSNIYNYSCCANTSNKPQQIVQPIDTNIQAYLPEQSASA